MVTKMKTETTTQQVDFRFDIYHLGTKLGYATYEEPDPDFVKRYFVEKEGYPHDIVVCLIKQR